MKKGTIQAGELENCQSNILKHFLTTNNLKFYCKCYQQYSWSRKDWRLEAIC